MKKSISLILFPLLLFAFTSTMMPSDPAIPKTPIPPGTIRIADNLYFDQSEITNLWYLEFLHWTQKVYGRNSDEYAHILPDTNVWSKLHAGYAALDTFYLKHPGYNYFPVVGVSYEQALAYSNWRSDRVLEAILVKKKIVSYRSNPHKDSIFTINKYFSGQYYGIQPDPNFLYYPYYSLPDSATYAKAFEFAETLNAKNVKHCRKKRCNATLLTGNHCLEAITDKDEVRPFGAVPTVQNNCSYCKKHLIAHLKGNVREMTDVKGRFYGNSFMDACDRLNNVIRHDSNPTNSFTGFRNRCEYRRWEN